MSCPQSYFGSTLARMVVQTHPIKHVTKIYPKWGYGKTHIHIPTHKNYFTATFMAFSLKENKK